MSIKKYTKQTRSDAIKSTVSCYIKRTDFTSTMFLWAFLPFFLAYLCKLILYYIKVANNKKRDVKLTNLMRFAKCLLIQRIE